MQFLTKSQAKSWKASSWSKVSKYRVRFFYKEKEEIPFKRKEHEKIFDGDEWDLS